MYKQIETAKEVWWGGIDIMKPLATLEDEYNRIHWVKSNEDDNCYILLVRAEHVHGTDCYRPSPWIFPEAAEVLADIINNERWKRAK